MAFRWTERVCACVCVWVECVTAHAVICDAFFMPINGADWLDFGGILGCGTNSLTGRVRPSEELTWDLLRVWTHQPIRPALPPLLRAETKGHGPLMSPSRPQSPPGFRLPPAENNGEPFSLSYLSQMRSDSGKYNKCAHKRKADKNAKLYYYTVCVYLIIFISKIFVGTNLNKCH